jgi:hypothetical protein
LNFVSREAILNPRTEEKNLTQRRKDAKVKTEIRNGSKNAQRAQESKNSGFRWKSRHKSGTTNERPPLIAPLSSLCLAFLGLFSRLFGFLSEPWRLCAFA